MSFYNESLLSLVLFLVEKLDHLTILLQSQRCMINYSSIILLECVHMTLDLHAYKYMYIGFLTTFSWCYVVQELLCCWPCEYYVHSIPFKLSNLIHI